MINGTDCHRCCLVNGVGLHQWNWSSSVLPLRAVVDERPPAITCGAGPQVRGKSCQSRVRCRAGRQGGTGPGAKTGQGRRGSRAVCQRQGLGLNGVISAEGKLHPRQPSRLPHAGATTPVASSAAQATNGRSAPPQCPTAHHPTPVSAPQHRTCDSSSNRPVPTNFWCVVAL